MPSTCSQARQTRSSGHRTKATSPVRVKKGSKGGDGKSKGSKEVGGAGGRGQLGGMKGNKYVPFLFLFLFSFVLPTNEITSLEKKTLKKVREFSFIY